MNINNKSKALVLASVGVIALFSLAIMFSGTGGTGYLFKGIKESPCVNCQKQTLECDTLAVDADGFAAATQGYTFCKDNGYTTCVSVNNHYRAKYHQKYNCSAPVERTEEDTYPVQCGSYIIDQMQECTGGKEVVTITRSVSCCRLR